jgi:hypothetical protein
MYVNIKYILEKIFSCYFLSKDSNGFAESEGGQGGKPLTLEQRKRYNRSPKTKAGTRIRLQIQVRTNCPLWPDKIHRSGGKGVRH